MAGSVKDLAVYRQKSAEESLETAKELLKSGRYKDSLNRSYYAVFHALRAVNALDEFDSRKHSGVIAHFNQYHVKNGDFPVKTSQIIRMASNLRESADYEDFFIASRQEAQEQIQNADFLLRLTAAYLSERF